jgi:hypothetical protein
LLTAKRRRAQRAVHSRPGRQSRLGQSRRRQPPHERRRKQSSVSKRDSPGNEIKRPKSLRSDPEPRRSPGRGRTATNPQGHKMTPSPTETVTRSHAISQAGAPLDRKQATTVTDTNGLWPASPLLRGPFSTSGRYWDRTSDLFRVRDKHRAQHSPTEHENSPWTSPDVRPYSWPLSRN